MNETPENENQESTSHAGLIALVVGGSAVAATAFAGWRKIKRMKEELDFWTMAVNSDEN